MKRIIAIVFVLTLLPFCVSFGQGGLVGGGVMFEAGGTTQFSSIAGATINIFTDEQSGFSTFNRTGMLYANGSPETQGAFTSLMMTVQTGLLGTYLGTGSQILWQTKEGSDEQRLMTKFELGAKIKSNLTVALSLDFEPVKDAGDKTFIYLLVDIRK